MRLVVGVVVAVGFLCWFPSNSMSQDSPLSPFARQTQGPYYSVGIQRFVNSFTSYEFVNPFPPGQDPLSRLEFPIDQWFVGVFSGYAAPSWLLVSQFWINLNRESALKMQDSDWDDETRPFQKTIFSESECRLNKGILADIGLVLPTPFMSVAGIRPVFGYRYQYFSFTTHDGFQVGLDGSRDDLPGDGIDFRQAFSHWYVGASMRSNLNFQPTRSLPVPIILDVQLDYGFVKAKNEDLHLLRSGYRITEENTRGHCWHVSARLSLLLRDRFTAQIEADFKRVLTNGDHCLTNFPFDIDFSFDGSKVWSDQATISATGCLSF